MRETQRPERFAKRGPGWQAVANPKAAKGTSPAGASGGGAARVGGLNQSSAAACVLQKASGSAAAAAEGEKASGLAAAAAEGEKDDEAYDDERTRVLLWRAASAAAAARRTLARSHITRCAECPCAGREGCAGRKAHAVCAAPSPGRQGNDARWLHPCLRKSEQSRLRTASRCV